MKDKIFNDWSDLVKKVTEWRADGQSIVFTNGCFDILHPGHVTYLNEAKQLGDKLVIGVNSDASVSKLKGSHRPIQNEQSRMLILAALASTDAVVVFTEDTPLNLISLLMPNILVKGGDYQISNIVGAEAVIANGGAVQVLPFLHGHATSAIEEKIIKGHYEQL